MAKTQTLSFPIRLPDAMQAGRLLRAQATRKQVFLAILPLLSAGLIRPAEGTRPAKKDYRAIKEQVRALRADREDADAFMALTNVVEQACNCYLETGVFPTTYEDLQAVPVQEVAQLTFAGDDGSRVAVLDVILEVPAVYVAPLEQESRILGWDWGVRSLITVSVLEKSEGKHPYRQVSRPVFLDTGGVDGRQARLRREIDRLKACRDRYVLLVKQAVKAQTEQKTPLPPHFAGWQEQITSYNIRIKTCWKKYERRNRELAHLASNLLILLALLHDCRLICGENLTTLKTAGRGRGVRGRWRNWRNNTTVRGELWRVLSYKGHLFGIRARQVEPRGTTHTCPHCGKSAKTSLSPALHDRKKAIDWGAWLHCTACGWNGARDYAASLNIARLGMAFLTTYQETWRYESYRMTDSSVKPALYIRAGATLLLPSQGITPRPQEGKHVSYAGWSYATSLRTSHPKKMLALLSPSRFRKRLLRSA